MRNDSEIRIGTPWRRHPLELSFEAHRRILLLKLRLQGRRRADSRPGRRRDRSTHR